MSIMCDEEYSAARYQVAKLTMELKSLRSHSKVVLENINIMEQDLEALKKEVEDYINAS